MLQTIQTALLMFRRQNNAWRPSTCATALVAKMRIRGWWRAVGKPTALIGQLEAGMATPIRLIAPSEGAFINTIVAFLLLESYFAPLRQGGRRKASRSQ